MKALLIVFVLLVVGVVGLGFFRGWFSFTSDSGDAKSNITLTVDQNKFQEDRKAVVENVQGMERRAKDAVAGPGEKNREGTIITVNGGELTMTDKEGKEHRHTLASDVEVTCDGKVCKAADLKPGMRIRVTTGSTAPHAATRIEALDQNVAFEPEP